ncbi:MAG: ABC transporter ATP-binding protein [Acidimicrobiia bacterium]|nr:ABC transporter ATP-binding protein [Acidimicrobiia bacterium]
MSPPVATLDRIGVRIGDTPILRDLDLTVVEGEAVGLMGANGSGKTTLLRVLATLLPPTAGAGRVLGAPLDGEGRYEVRPRIALVGHEPALYAELTLEENLALVARLSGAPLEVVDDALSTVGLARARTRRAGQSSQGMRRRVEFARILITRPDLLLLDEAHSGLDPAAVALVDHLVSGVRARRGAAVIVSHDRNRIAATVDRVVELAGGRL